MFRVSILDNSPLFLLGMVKALTDRGFFVVEAQTSMSDKTIRMADILIVDPDAIRPRSFIDFLTEVPQALPILVIVNDQDVATLEEYTRVGATGLVRRSAPLDVFYEAVITVGSGGKYIDPRLSHFAADDSRDEQTAGTEFSPREHQVLRYVAQGMTHHQIARKLGISQHTVDTYIRRIRNKTGLGNKAELTKAAIAIDEDQHRRRIGYRKGILKWLE